MARGHGHRGGGGGDRGPETDFVVFGHYRRLCSSSANGVSGQSLLLLPRDKSSTFPSKKWEIKLLFLIDQSLGHRINSKSVKDGGISSPSRFFYFSEMLKDLGKTQNFVAHLDFFPPPQLSLHLLRQFLSSLSGLRREIIISRLW